jgi:recombination protein RecR
MKPVSFEYLFDAIHSLPGIGKKHAERIAYFLINKDEQYINDFIRRIKSAHNDIHFCQQCNNITSNELCEICTNDSRNTNLLCIVSSCEDLEKIENTNSYLGYYYVLNGEIDIKTKTVFNEKQIQKILNFISLKKFNEIIFATD